MNEYKAITQCLLFKVKIVFKIFSVMYAYIISLICNLAVYDLLLMLTRSPLSFSFITLHACHVEYEVLFDQFTREKRCFETRII